MHYKWKEEKERKEQNEVKGDLISREALKNDLITFFPDKCLEGITAKTLFKQILTDINNAPTVKEVTRNE